MDFEIIPADMSTADELGFIHAQSWQQAYKGIISDEYLAGITPQKQAGLFEKIANTGMAVYYLFRVNGESAGMAALCKDREEVGEKYGEISAIYFLSQFWGLDYTHQAMRFCLERLRDDGRQIVTIWVLEDNIRARKFYESFGFTEQYLFDYKYMKKFMGKPTSPYATISQYTHYVLVNDDTVTWERIEKGLTSALSTDWVDYKMVYINLT